MSGSSAELYDLTKDWTQCDDFAAKYPAKLKELKNLFWAEANKYQVLPLDASAATRAVAPRPSLTAGRTNFRPAGVRRLPGPVPLHGEARQAEPENRPTKLTPEDIRRLENTASRAADNK